MDQQYLNKKLFEAVEKGDVNMVKQLIQEGADVNANYFRHGHLYERTHALLVAVDNEDIEMIKTLIEMGADINGTDHYGNTPLILSVQEGNMELIEYLVEHGADLDKKNDFGETALRYSLYVENDNIPIYLLEHGADYSNVRERYVFQQVLKNETEILKDELTNNYLTLERGTPQVNIENRTKSLLPKNLLLKTIYEKPYQEYCSNIDGKVPPIQLIALANILKLDYNINITWIDLCDKIKNILYLLL